MRRVASGRVGSGLMFELGVVIIIDERNFAEMAGDCPASVGGATRGGPQVGSQ
jgi:hypothetical protein